MKIVLFALNGSFSHTNLAIRCLRAPLLREGHEVVLVEHTLRDRSAHILEHLVSERADVYGFSCYVWSFEETVRLAQTLKSLLPDTHVVLGGPEVSFDTERFDGMEWIDAIVRFGGEEAMAELCRAIAQGKRHERVIEGKRGALRGAGILYRDGEADGGIAYYESSRGCPYACAYCLSSAERGVEYKSAEETLADMEEFERLHSRVRIIKFVDRTFNADVARAKAIWQGLLSPRFTKAYHFELNASLLDEESIELLSRFPKGKVQLEFGLQSTNEQTLAAVCRHIDPTRVIENVRRVHALGNIHVHLDLIAGLPFESYARFARSFDDAYGSCDLLQLGFLKLLHGTPLRRSAEEYGYVSLPNPPYTVLQSRWITYGEMTRLSRIAEVLDRYLESGRFSHALWYLCSRMPSPFAFWEGLADHLAAHDPRPLQRVSQPDAFRHFLDYAKALPQVEEAALKEMLRADFSEAENKNPPAFLR